MGIIAHSYTQCHAVHGCKLHNSAQYPHPNHYVYDEDDDNNNYCKFGIVERSHKIMWFIERYGL